MATWSFASLAHVTLPCGSSSRDPQDVQCITLSECNEDVSTHLKKLNVGPDTINDEKTLGAFHSTKNAGMKFRVFHVTNVTVFSSWLDQAFPGFAREYEVNDGNKWWRTLCLFYLLWSCSTTPEVKTSDVSGEDDDITLFSVAKRPWSLGVASSYKRRN